jgi:hypothetical protein
MSRVTADGLLDRSNSGTSGDLIVQKPNCLRHQMMTGQMKRPRPDNEKGRREVKDVSYGTKEAIKGTLAVFLGVFFLFALLLLLLGLAFDFAG